jgi:hypothetical protein
VCYCSQCRGKVVSRATYYRHATVKAIPALEGSHNAPPRQEVPLLRKEGAESSFSRLHKFEPYPSSVLPKLNSGASAQGRPVGSVNQPVATAAPTFPSMPLLTQLPISHQRDTVQAAPTAPVVPAAASPSMPSLASANVLPPPQAAFPSSAAGSMAPVSQPTALNTNFPMPPFRLASPVISQWYLQQIGALATQASLPLNALQSLNTLTMQLATMLDRPDFVGSLQRDLALMQLMQNPFQMHASFATPFSSAAQRLSQPFTNSTMATGAAAPNHSSV